MPPFSIVGPSYSSQSVNADCQITRNWYPEQIESGMGKAKVALYGTPGKKIFCTLLGNQHRGSIEINDRAFVICSTNFYEVFANGTFNLIGQVLDDFKLGSMTASPQQVLFCAGGGLYVFYLQAVGAVPAGTFVKVNPAFFVAPDGSNGPISKVAYIDGFFLVLLANSQTFYYSTPADAASWPGLQKNIVSVFSDNIVDMQALHRQLYLLGRKKSVVYYDSGSSSQFDVIPGSDMEVGAAGLDTSCILDNTLFWLARDSRGVGMLNRAQGYTPARVSNHAVEFAWQGYLRQYGQNAISDARTYAYQEDGHSFCQIYFPTANKTWVYDVATGWFHERQFSQGITASADRAQTHMEAFGKHLVGDWKSGNLYDQSINYVDDFGTSIQRLRRATHISNENKWTYFSELIIDMECGIAGQPPLLDGNGNPRAPEIMLRWSDDFAHTWSNEYQLSFGQAGQYKQRMRKSRMGRARDRVFEISTSDPVPARIINAYVTVAST